jgi:pyridoxamine 5'-phosphate oxidase family protein
MTSFSPAVIAYLDSQLVGRLATSDADGRPHVVPVSFRFNAELNAVESGGFHVDTSKRFRNVQANPWAAIVIDDIVSVDPWTPRMVAIRGRAEALPTGGAELRPGFGDPMIRIHADRVNVFGIE